MSSSIDTIRRLAGLTGEYVISDKDAKLQINKDDINIESKGLTKDELNSYDVFPIIDIEDAGLIVYVNPNEVQYEPNKFVQTFVDRTQNFMGPSIDKSTGDKIVFICRNSQIQGVLPVHNFWCQSMNFKYIRRFTEMQPLNPKYEGRYLWYYGIKKGSKGGRPLRPATFRQRRPKRTTSKSRRRATRRRRV